MRHSGGRRREAASESVEDYLKNIYALRVLGDKVTTSMLSRRLKISPPSVSEMLKRLNKEGTVVHAPYKGVDLTAQGYQRAVQIIRRHRLWELFLVEYLNYPWDEIHEEAERLEHITSDKLAERLDALLGYPERDPHGDAIPSARGKVGRTARCSLASTAPGTTVIVERVSDASPDILKVATRLGIALRKKVRVIERIAFDGSLLVRVGGKQQYISPSLAQNIFVKT